jgi:hypothetical protein
MTTRETLQLIIDGERACALTHYDLQSPSGHTAPFPK